MCSCCQQKPRFFVDPEVAAINDRACSGQRCAPVTIIKRECPQHPGCYTMSDECERCIDEQFRRNLDRILSGLFPVETREGDQPV